MKFGIKLAFCISTIGALSSLSAQSLTMDGESGIFFQPWAMAVPSDHGSFGGTTMSVHTVGLSPVFGSLYNVGVEEGFGGFLEFGYTRNFHTDGGNPNISPLVNFNGMNLFNFKAVILKGGYKKAKYVPAVAVGGVLRTNDPYISEKLAGHTTINGDIYVVGTEVFPVTKKIAVLLNGGVRGTNAETNGFDGVARSFEARGFAGIAFPITIAEKFILAPAFEFDQQPHLIKYATGTTWPSTLVYAIRFGRAPDFKWSIDGGMGHVAGQVAPTVNLKANNGIAFAMNYRF